MEPSTTTLPDFGRFPPIPRNSKPQAWLIDTNRKIRPYYGVGPKPPTYTDAGFWLRHAMGPDDWKLKVGAARHRVEMYLTCRLTPIRDILSCHDGTPRQVAELLIETALFEDGSPFVMATVWPDGLVEVRSAQSRYAALLHPDAIDPATPLPARGS